MRATAHPAIVRFYCPSLYAQHFAWVPAREPIQMCAHVCMPNGTDADDYVLMVSARVFISNAKLAANNWYMVAITQQALLNPGTVPIPETEPEPEPDPAHKCNS